MSEENKAIMRHIYEEVFNQGNLDLVDGLVASEFVNRTAPPETPPGPEAVKRLVTMLRNAFPDHHTSIEDTLAEGDKVAMRATYSGTHEGDFMGIPSTGERFVQNQIHIMRFADGKVVEHWSVRDDLGQMQQLGVVPAPGQT